MKNLGIYSLIIFYVSLAIMFKTSSQIGAFILIGLFFISLIFGMIALVINLRKSKEILRLSYVNYMLNLSCSLSSVLIVLSCGFVGIWTWPQKHSNPFWSQQFYWFAWFGIPIVSLFVVWLIVMFYKRTLTTR